MVTSYIGTIDQGTTSTRFILFNKRGEIVASHQIEHKQHYPQPGWVEHDPIEIIDNTISVIKKTIAKLSDEDFCIESVGITNQRETVVAWNKKSGKPYYNGIVWQDGRGRRMIDDLILAGKKEIIHEKTGLIPSPYFAASKISWLLKNCPDFAADVSKGEALIGTIDSWVLWNLCGANELAAHVTDVTNASRFMLMDIKKLQWDQELLNLFEIPKSVLAQIRASIPNEPYGMATIDKGASEISFPIAAILGDQQAALFGQACFFEGESKCTYGTGGFLLMNTGKNIIHSKNGLLTTVAYQKEGEEPTYALEGAIAVAGSLVQWIRDNLGLIKDAAEIDKLAMEVEDCGGVYFVPAFAGLFAPWWEPSARGIICGLTGYARKQHLCRAVLESSAFQVRDLFKAISQDSGMDLPLLKVDGGMVVSEPLMQMQADFLGVCVVRPKVIETTALGAAYAAGLSCGFWKDRKELATHWAEDKRWTAKMSKKQRLVKIMDWEKAIKRSLGWV